MQQTAAAADDDDADDDVSAAGDDDDADAAAAGDDDAAAAIDKSTLIPSSLTATRWYSGSDRLYYMPGSSSIHFVELLCLLRFEQIGHYIQNLYL